MSLRAPLVYIIPEHRAQVARAAFPRGNPHMRMRDTLGPIYTNPELAHLFPNTGQPAEAPAHPIWQWTLYLHYRTFKPVSGGLSLPLD